MKRSKVLKKIQDLYKLELENYPKNNPPDVFAENLLGHLEEAGMLPPYHNPYGRLEGHIQYCQWEPEDAES